ncbi:MAG: universal stress protein [Eubacteriales bacterium]|jgi:nucleotide-binding universal stress UspA family protein
MKRIVVAVDGSESSLRAVSHALKLKKLSSHMHVTAFYVGPSCYDLFPEPGACSGFQQKELDKEIESRANEVFKKIDRLAGQKSSIIEKAIGRGDAAAVISKFAMEGGFDLVIMGFHGYDEEEGSRFWLGGVCYKVLHMCQCPVTIVK